MKSAVKNDTKKSAGRPATGIGIQIGTRWPPGIVRLVDEWRRDQDDLPGRPEAIRRLVELGLTIKTTTRPVSKSGRRLRAQELAINAIEKMIDPSAPPEERAQRRRRLTKGPTEFREDRVDLPKAKRK
jgi:hypothetical protein